MKLFNKDGEVFNVPFAVDAKEWIATGDYFKDNPKEAKKAKKETAKK